MAQDVPHLFADIIGPFDSQMRVNLDEDFRAVATQIITLQQLGVSPSASQADTRAALQAAIAVANARGGGLVLVTGNYNYGLKESDSTTYPDFSAVTVDGVEVWDMSIGNTYVAPAKDGAKFRRWMWTLETVPANQHDGDGMIHHGREQPYFLLSNDAVLTGLATDNLRAFYWTGRLGVPVWGTGQSTRDNATVLQMMNWCIRFIGSAIGSPMGDRTPLIIDAQTLGFWYGVESNASDAQVHFKQMALGLYQMVVESLGTTCDLLLRNSNGTGDDVGLRSTSTDLNLRVYALGDALSVRKNTRRVWTTQSHRKNRSTVAYSAAMNIDSTVANVFTITATNATPFTINSPTGGEDGCYLTVTVRNTSGGALGAATWGGLFKMAAWVNPATGFSRSITFHYDGTNWIEASRTPADVPN